MSVENNQQLKDRFKNGQSPTAEDMWALIDSMRNLGIKVPAIDVNGLTQVVNTYYTDEAVPASVPVGNGFQRWVTKTVGSYPGFPDSMGNPLTVDAGNLAAGIVEFWGKGGVWERKITNITVNALTILTNQIVDQAITPTKTNFLTVGKNKFDINASDNVLDKFVDHTTGTLTTNVLYNATGFIPVTAGLPYTVSYKHTIAWYNSSKVYISGNASTDTNKTQIAPVGAAFMRTTVIKGSWTTYQIEQGSAQTTFESFGYLLTAFPTIRVNSQSFLDSSIAKEKLNFLKSYVGKNKFNINASDVELGKYVIYNTGVPDVNSAFNLTGFIKVSAGTSYVLSYKHQIAWYDQARQFISGSPSADTNKVQVAPVGAVYLRASVILASWSTFQVEEGSVQTAFAAFEEHFYFADGAQNIEANAVTSSLQSSLVAAVISALSINTANLINGAVTPLKTSFLPIGKNLFNKNDTDVQLGRYVDYTSGNTTANAAYNATGFIPVVAGAQYTLSYKHQIAFYNASKVYISGSHNTDTNKTQTMPVGAAFMRCTVTLASWDSFQVEAGAVQTSFEQYQYVLKSADNIPIGVTVQVSPETVQTIFATAITKPVSLAVAPKMYIPINREIALYYENMQKYEEYKAKTDIALTGAKITGRAAKLMPVGTGSVTATINVFNEQFDSVLTKSTIIEATDPAVVTPVVILNLGDSYTYRSTFVNQLMASSGTGVTFVGMRVTTASTPSNLSCEGRGGYALSTYTTLQKGIVNYSPFMQPSGVYKYYGVTGFWKLVKTPPASPADYDYVNYATSIKNLFSTSTGYLVAPVANDVMFDDVAQKFYCYSGSAWVEILEATLAFTFNFAKYRTTFGIAAPNVVHIPLGVNDFNGASETQMVSLWTAWKTRMDTVIASIKADIPTVKIIIGIPNSSGKQGEEGVAFYEKRKRALWYHANQLIANYSGREAESLYLVDYHSCCDRQFGYDYADEKPFNRYTGSYREQYKADATHLGLDGFAQMGDLYHGIIQKLR